MKKFLRKIKLIDNFRTAFYFNKAVFVSRLKTMVKPGFVPNFPILKPASELKYYKGHVGNDGFKINKNYMEKYRGSMAIIEAKLVQNNEKLIIDTHISLSRGTKVVVVFVLALTIFFTFNDLAKLAVLENGKIGSHLIIILRAIVWIGLTYLFCRWDIYKARKKVEKDYQSILRNNY